MRYRLLFALLAVATVTAGCATSNPQTLRFKDFRSVCGHARLSTDIRYHFGEGWSLPKAPGTVQAYERENFFDYVRSGLQFRIFGEAHYREADDGDIVRAGEWAAVDDATFGPGPVEGVFRFTRERLGFNFGLFIGRNLCSFGIGFFYHGIQLDGSVRNATTRGSLHNDNTGFGYMLWLEISPGFPPLRMYVTWAKWDAYEGKGYWKGEETEIGLKYRLFGFEAFAGYRMEEFAGRTEHSFISQSRLKFYLKGPVLGVGVAF
jgi:hypothetical protein